MELTFCEPYFHVFATTAVESKSTLFLLTYGWLPFGEVLVSYSASWTDEAHANISKTNTSVFGITRVQLHAYMASCDFCSPGSYQSY